MIDVIPLVNQIISIVVIGLSFKLPSFISSNIWVKWFGAKPPTTCFHVFDDCVSKIGLIFSNSEKNYFAMVFSVSDFNDSITSRNAIELAFRDSKVVFLADKKKNPSGGIGI